MSLSPDFTRIWAAESISLVGDPFTVLALPSIAALTLHASAFSVAALAATAQVGFPLLGLVAGITADRRRRRPIMVTAYLTSAVALGSLPVASALGVLRLPQLFLVGFVLSCASAFGHVASRSYIPSVLPAEQLLEGNSRLEASRAVAQTAGPGLAGVLIGWVGGAGAVLVDAVSYVGAGAVLTRVRAAEETPTAGERGLAAAVRDVREGAGFLLRHRILGPIIVRLIVANFCVGAAFALLPVLAYRVLGISPTVLGALSAAGGVAGIVGATVAPRINRRLGVANTLLACTAVESLGLGLGAAAAWLGVWSLLAGLVLLGAVLPVWQVTSVGLRQAVTPKALIGRVMATSMTLAWGAGPVGAILGGAVVAGLSGPLGLPAAVGIVIGSAAGLMVLGAGALLRPGLRQVHTMPTTQDQGALRETALSTDLTS